MSYESVFSWRYGSPAMRQVFSEVNRRLLWRKVWVALARAQKDCGLVSEAELKAVEENANKVDLEKSNEVEKQIRHDLMAELKVFAEQCGEAGGRLHLGATSMDVVDNADVLAQREALELTKKRLAALLRVFADKISEHKDKPCMGFTHLQPAEPTTVGYRLAVSAQDLLNDLKALEALRLKGKGFKGAVGTSASFVRLLEAQKVSAKQMEANALKHLGLQAFFVSSQTYPRKQDYLLLTALAGAAQSLHKLALDVRLLQNPLSGEWSEPFGEKQVGSSAMPFKKNPISSERICSLARLVAVYPQVAWGNAANSMLERTLDDSANKRVIVPEAFLALDECLLLALKVVEGLQVNAKAIEKNLNAFAPFAACEAVLMKIAEKGADRQKAHDWIREHSLKAWEAVQRGEPNPLLGLLAGDMRIAEFVPEEDLRRLFDVSGHVGEASEKSEALTEDLKKATSEYAEEEGKASY